VGLVARPDSAPARLRVEGLSKRFGGVNALSDVDLQVGEAETLGLIGPNGSGKTTLVNCVSGVLASSGGDVYLEGTAVTNWSRRRRARAGLIRTYQSVRLFPQLTVAENVESGLLCGPRVQSAERRRLVLTALEQQGLASVARTPVSDLSYGAQRRVEIARALIAEPRVLLLDEPAAGLGDEETAELHEVLTETRQRVRLSILIIDHDVSLIMGISDRITVLHEGSVLATGRPAEVARDPAVLAAYLGPTSVRSAGA
jgi:branched-chain amino acid transport system ATP-binding protein